MDRRYTGDNCHHPSERMKIPLCPKGFYRETPQKNRSLNETEEHNTIAYLPIVVKSIFQIEN